MTGGLQSFVSDVVNGSAPDRSLLFIQNLGQVDSEVNYYARTPLGSLYLTRRGVFIGLAVHENPEEPGETDVYGIPLSIEFDSPDPNLEVRAAGRSSAVFNELLGSDLDRWRAGLPGFTDVVYSGLYDGIDLVYNGRFLGLSPGSLGLKGTYIVQPGADPHQIRWSYSENWDIQLDREGNLLLHLRPQASSTEEMILSEKAPVAWQRNQAGEVVWIPIRYRLSEDRLIGFALASYDSALPLYIDPELEYSTFLGGTSTDEGFDVAIDGARNAIVVGSTISVDFPSDFPPDDLLVGNRNIFVAKLTNDGSGLEFSTIIGGSGDDIGRSISVDSTGEIYLTGTTDSDDFPASLPSQRPEESGIDFFAIKLSLTGGQLRYSRVFGGSGTDESKNITADSTGSAYIAGLTDSSDYPTFEPFQPVNAGGATDGFVMKLSPLGDTVVFSSYLGGSGEDVANAVAVDRRGSAYLTGVTSSVDIPTRAVDESSSILQDSLFGNHDAFLFKLTPDGGGHLFATYLSEGEATSGNDIALDSDGNAYIVGTVDSLESAGTDGSADVFVIAVEAGASRILYRTTIGGSGDEEGYGIGLDRQRNVYLIGETESEDLATSGVIQPGYAGNRDAFISQIGPDGGLITTHYLGGSEFDSGRAIAVAGNGDALAAGMTVSADFPTLNAYQSSYQGEGDAFIAKISEVEFIPTPVPTETPPPPPPPPPPTPTPTEVQTFVQSNTFLYLLLGLTGLVFLLIILDFIIGKIRKRRRRKKSDF